MNVTVLVDFENDSVRTALEVAAALGPDLWGVRLDTSDRLADESLRARAAATTRRPASRRSSSRLVRAELDAARLRATCGSSSPAASRRRGSARSRPTGVPVDSYGVGSSLIRGANDFTADVVVVDGRPCAKVGRELRPNPRLEPVS